MMWQLYIGIIGDQWCLAVMGYGNYDVRQAGKDNGALKEYEEHGFRIVSVCGWHILRKSVVFIECWQYYGVCEDYNGVVSKVLGDEWINPRILSVQSLEAHHRMWS